MLKAETATKGFRNKVYKNFLQNKEIIKTEASFLFPIVH